MATTISKEKIYGVLFIVCIVVPNQMNFELTFALWSLTALFSLTTTYSFTILRLAACYTAILAIAFIVMFFHDYKAYYIIRDITYMIRPVLGLLLGYQLCKYIYPKGFRILVYAGVAMAAVHIMTIIYAVIFNHVTNLNTLRLRAGFFSDFEIYAFVILIFREKFQLDFSKKKWFYYLAIVGISSFMYLARTNFIQFGLLILAMRGILKINKASLTVIAGVIVFVSIGYASIVYSNPKRNGPGFEGMLYKIKIAPREAFKTKINTADWKDFNDNYRSYENITTVKQVTNKGTTVTIFGEGVGSQIDLKQKVWLLDMYLQYISILHNGYMTVLLKSGLLGICIFLYATFLLFRQKRSQIPIIQNINLLLIGTGVFLFFSTWVFSGLYNLLDNKVILIGFLICYKEITIKKEIISLKEQP